MYVPLGPAICCIFTAFVDSFLANYLFYEYYFEYGIQVRGKIMVMDFLWMGAIEVLVMGGFWEKISKMFREPALPVDWAALSAPFWTVIRNPALKPCWTSSDLMLKCFWRLKLRTVKTF